jgi:AcrR family transcriptional regulator
VSTVEPASRPLRSDALRNRARLVASARELFATKGADVPVEEITRHAGVGMGTLYRHFATKEDLIDAVLEETFAGFLAAAEDALAEDDAWTGFCGFLQRSLALHVANRALKDMLIGQGTGLSRGDEVRARVRPLLAQLIERAKAQGSLRADFVPEDLPLVFWTSDRVIDATAAIAPECWRRYLGMLLDGLRAEAATPLPAPPLTAAQVAGVKRRRAA